MNAYAVCIPEIRSTYDYYQTDPSEPYLPCGIFVAETPAQAKADALRSFTAAIQAGVYSDDWPSLRARKIVSRIRRTRGEVGMTDTLWRLWPDNWPSLTPTATTLLVGPSA